MIFRKLRAIKRMYEDQIRELHWQMNVLKDKLQLESDKQMAGLARQCAEQINEREHEFHQGKEDKWIVLAGLDAKIEERREWLKTLHLPHQEMVNQLNGENGRLYQLLKDHKCPACNCQVIK